MTLEVTLCIVQNKTFQVLTILVKESQKIEQTRCDICFLRVCNCFITFN